MIRLPVCPHCGTVYRYRDTKDAWKQKENTCYHCQKKFRVRLMPYVIVEALILLPLCVGFNLLMLNRMEKLNLFALFAATLFFLLLGYLLIPFFVRFIKMDEDKDNKNLNHKKKNRKQPIKKNNESNRSKIKQNQHKNKKRRS